jgi:hypothetical protein
MELRMVAGEGLERMPVVGSVLEPPLGSPERPSETYPEHPSGSRSRPAEQPYPSGPAPGVALPPALRRCRRLVAAAVRFPEFLLAASGLTQRLAAAGVPIDVLVAASGDERSDHADLRALSELASPSARRHRLALPMPFGDDREDDLVAALSELIGFDPEPGVFCLVPVGDDPCRAAVRRAAGRLARVYRMRLLGYSSAPGPSGAKLVLEPAEWRRKSAALAACSSAIPMPADDRRERFVPA